MDSWVDSWQCWNSNRSRGEVRAHDLPILHRRSWHRLITRVSCSAQKILNNDHNNSLHWAASLSSFLTTTITKDGSCDNWDSCKKSRVDNYAMPPLYVPLCSRSHTAAGLVQGCIWFSANCINFLGPGQTIKHCWSSILTLLYNKMFGRLATSKTLLDKEK